MRAGLVSNLRGLFLGRDYRRLLVTRVTGQFGDGAFQVGLAGLFFFSPERETTPTGVAWALTASLLPYTLVGPFAGVLLDRWFRRQVLLIANLTRAALAVLAAILVASGQVNAWLLIVVLSCLSVDRFVLAGLGAGLPHVVEPTMLVAANSVTPTLGTISHVLGGAAAYLLTRLGGLGDRGGVAAISLACVVYLQSAVAVRTLAVDSLGPHGGPRRAALRRQLLDLAVGMGHGARHLAVRPRARWSMVLTAVCRIGFGTFAIMAILLCRNEFSAGDVQRGLTMIAGVGALAGVGAGLAAVGLPPAVNAVGLSTVTVAALGLAAGVYLTWAAVMTPVVLLTGALVLGLTMQMVKIVVDTTLQTTVDENYLGRAFSLYDMTFNASFVAAAALAAVWVPMSGHAPGLLVLLGVLVAGSATFTAFSRHSRPVAPSEE